MIENLPFLFDSDKDSPFDDCSMAEDNLNNHDPDLFQDYDTLEYENIYDDWGIIDPIKDGIRRGVDRVGGEDFMKYVMPFAETMADYSSEILKTQSEDKQLKSMHEELTENRKESLPKRSFERLVSKVISGEIKRNNVN